MKWRLLALLAVAAVAGISAPALPRQAPPSQESLGQVLPPLLGPFHSVRQWQVQPAAGTTEIVADYADAQGSSAQLDLWLGRTGGHNGIACFLTRDAVLHWYGLRRLVVADDPAGIQFEVALVRDERTDPARIALVATTECRHDGCAENEPIRGMPERSSLRWHGAADGVAPVLLLVSQDGATPDEETLQRRLREFASQIRLAPVRAMAASQPGGP